MSTDYPLTDYRMKDGSRNFLTLPCAQAPSRLWRSLRKLPHVKRGKFIQGVTETWITFSWQGKAFSIQDPFGEYWFFAEDPDTSEDLLQQVRRHFLQHAL